MRLRVAFYKLAGSRLVIQFEYIDERLRCRSSVRSERARMTIYSDTRPELPSYSGYSDLYIPGSSPEEDHDPLFVRFDNDEARDDWIRRARMALTHYVRRRGARLDVSHERGPSRTSVLAL